MDYIYDAFLSYRHLPADMAVAEKLQTLLEGRKKKDGTKLKIFRDRSELPTSSDLASNIRRALETSRYLIVICTPSYQESKWCMEELTYFRKIHGGNGKIIPILVVGEPDESFPEVLCYEERSVLGQDGNPTVVRIEVEPLAADVRGDTHAERMKKLRTEYLRVAAPILGVTFDQLYQRAERKKRRIYAMVIAALAAFLAYSIFMIAQINRRQNMLEEKQQELYQNESIRLSNEAMLLETEDPALAMLLANAALPENLSDPDYPLAPEAEMAIRSAAVQHQYDEATAAVILRYTIRFKNREGILADIYDNGRYFEIYDNGKTSLYEAQTGFMISELSGAVHGFFDGVNRYVLKSEERSGDSRDWESAMILTSYSVGDTRTGEELGHVEQISMENPYLIYDEDSQRLWVAGFDWDPDTDTYIYDTCGWFDLEGVFHEEHILPEHLRQEQLISDFASGLDGTSDGINDICRDYRWKLDIRSFDMDAEQQRIADSIEAKLNDAEGTDAYEIYQLYGALDGAVYMLEFGGYEYDRHGYGVWSVEEDRLIWLDRYTEEDFRCQSILEVNTGLLYRMTSEELQVYQVNPSSFDLPQAPPPFDYVSEDGKYGFAQYDTWWNGKEASHFFAYDTSRLRDVRYTDMNYHPEYLQYSGFLEEKGAYQYIVDWRKGFDISADGSRLLVGGSTKELIDTVTGKRIATVGFSGESFALNEDGTLIACDSQEEDGTVIYLYDPDARKYVGQIRLEGITDGQVREISGNILVASAADRVYVYDLENPEKECWSAEAEGRTIGPWHEIVDAGMLSGISGLRDRPMVTKDGLLILPGGYMDALCEVPVIQGIFDLETGEVVGFSPTTPGAWSDYAYDDVGGNLIQQEQNSFVVQRRGESGDFEVVYTITPKHSDMMLHAAGHACDGPWLVLQNEEVCEIYRLEDGVLCYSIRKPEGRVSQMAVIDGKLFDFCVGWDRVCIPLPDTGEARAYVRDVLTTENSRRTLSDQEMKEYYIPSHWQEK